MTTAYRSLVDADSSQTIAPGTWISVSNWQQYKNFMPIGTQVLFSRDYHWSIPSGPDGEMVVGPTIAIPSPYSTWCRTICIPARCAWLAQADTRSVGVANGLGDSGTGAFLQH